MLYLTKLHGHSDTPNKWKTTHYYGWAQTRFSLSEIRYSSRAPSDQFKHQNPGLAVELNYAGSLLACPHYFWVMLAATPTAHISTGRNTSPPVSPLHHFRLTHAHWERPPSATQKCQPWSISLAKNLPKMLGTVHSWAPGSRPKLAKTCSRLWFGSVPIPTHYSYWNI